ncbi:glycosyltransferase [Pseudoalteromonas sp.]|uniref:glycosyltransferase n=1 Tax=Pseudoalteromonas sp. TaxID=53249 RepID=UPI003516899E
MDFSVLMSVYINDDPVHLDASLLSIFSQSLCASQVVLVADGPLTQDVHEVINQYSEKFRELHIFYLPENLGLPSALNFGLEKCINEVIIRCDADDINHHHRFEKLIECMETGDYSAIGSFVEEFDESTTNLRVRKVPSEHEDISLALKKRNPMNHPSISFLKSAVLNCGAYDVRLKNGQDYELWARMISRGYKFKNIPECLVSFRVSKEMIKRRGGRKYISYDLIIAKKLKEYGFLNLLDFYVFFITRAVGRLLPNDFRLVLYKLCR